MLARCPTCRNTFSTDHPGRQDCPVCGKPLVVPDTPKPIAPIPVQSAPPEAESAQGTPWERRAELGTLTAWLQTIQQALFEPVKLFRSARLDRGSAQLGFALLTSSVFWSVGQLFERLLLKDRLHEQTQAMIDALGDRVSPLMRKLIDTSQAATSPGWTLALVLFTPVFSYLLLYLNVAVTHGFALVLGQAKRGFPATFAACAYACSPLVLMAVPGCGSLIAALWLIVLTGIGLKETHRMSTGGAASSVLAPYAVLCCLILGASLVLAMTLRQTLGQP